MHVKKYWSIWVTVLAKKNAPAGTLPVAPNFVYKKIYILSKMIFYQKWVAVARIGLILWENDATGLRIISKHLPGLKLDFFLILFLFFIFSNFRCNGF